MTSTEVIHRNALEIVEGFASARHMVKPKKQWGDNGNKSQRPPIFSRGVSGLVVGSRVLTCNLTWSPRAVLMKALDCQPQKCDLS